MAAILNAMITLCIVTLRQMKIETCVRCENKADCFNTVYDNKKLLIYINIICPPYALQFFLARETKILYSIF